jgi:two-component system, OmpR family, sensor histidine kinase KdpD
LTIFFGAAPGVGKTQAMLAAARARRGDGVDVLVGWIEAHSRADTVVLAEDIPRLPTRDANYRGMELSEFDLNGALARKPGLLLLDGLAHANVPGSRHLKRWQDVVELLDSGIDVYSTLNVQEVESLNDLVNQITGVSVRETVPDRMLDNADNLVFIDLLPEELLRRVVDGKVGRHDRAEQAASTFFRRGSLLALRELALRRTADHVDRQVREYRREHEIKPAWLVAERMLVGVRPNSASDRLVRAARRIAAQLEAEWIVVYVETPNQAPLSPGERAALAATFRLAEELGAETAAVSGESVSEGLLALSRERNVSQIVIGKPLHGRLRDRLKGSLVDEIVRGSDGIEVHVVPGGRADSGAAGSAPPVPASARLSRYAWPVGVVGLFTLLCWPLRGRVDGSNLVLLALLGVVLVASRYGHTAAAVAALLSAVAFEFLFVAPSVTFAAHKGQFLITLVVMLVVGQLVGGLAVRVKSQATMARRREQRTQALYSLSREMAAVRSRDAVAEALCRHVSHIFNGRAELYLPGPDGALAARGGGVWEEQPEARDAAFARWTFDHGQMAGLGTNTLPGASSLYVPLSGAGSVVGVLGVRPAEDHLPLGPDQLDLIAALTRHAALAVERLDLERGAQAAHLAIESERMHKSLLSSVSHELRTPLATITGAASMLLERGSLDTAAQREMTESICEEADRLNHLIRNLLDMTRFESEALRLETDWQSVEELVGSALTRLDASASSRDVAVSIPEDFPLVMADAQMMERVFVNLLENAFRYAGPGTPISVNAIATDDTVMIEVSDQGSGLPSGAEEHIFEKFYRGPSSGRGFGLGLPICKAIVAAHGGRIWAAPNAPRGTVFRFTLPKGDAPPPFEEMNEGHAVHMPA